MAGAPRDRRLKELRETTLLLGEGVEEQELLGALLKAVNLTGVQVEQYEGKSNLGSFLTALQKFPGYANLEAIGITRDADTNARGSFQSVCSALKNAGLPFPAESGQVVSGPPRIGVLILPPGQAQGMLEDVCLAAIRDDPAMVCVDEFLECVRAKANRQPTSPAKARVHVWLASHVHPDKRLGEAAQAGYWPWGSPAFDPLKEFLARLARRPGGAPA